MNTPDPPPGPPAAPLGAPTEPLAPAARAPRLPQEAPPPPRGSYPLDGSGYARERALWWQNEAAIIAIGLLMLVLGGVVGYLVGHAHARVRTVAAASGKPSHTVYIDHTTTTVTASHTVVAHGGTPASHVTVVAHTVTAPARTVTVRQPPHVVHSTTTHTVTVTSTSTTTASSSQAGSSPPQTFSGSGNGTVGTIHVASASQLKWSCTGCASGSFAVTNSPSDSVQFAVQAQNSSSGQASVAPGTYTSVTVQATGPWSITIAATSP